MTASYGRTADSRSAIREGSTVMGHDGRSLVAESRRRRAGPNSGSPVAGRDARGSPVTDLADSTVTHARLFREHAWFRWLSGIPGDKAGGADPQALDKALRSGRVLVRIDLAPE